MSTTQKVLKSSPMTINFQTTLNGKNYKGTVNVKEALEAQRGQLP